MDLKKFIAGISVDGPRVSLRLWCTVVIAIGICALFGAQVDRAQQLPAKAPLPVTNPKPAPKLDYASAYTSAAQMKDLKASDEYYAAVQDMLDQHGYIYAYDDGRFHADLPLTQEQFAVFLETGLAKLVDAVQAKNKDLSLSVGSASADVSDRGKVFYSGYSLNRLNIDTTNLEHGISVSKVPDVKESDEVRVPLQSLMERYGIDFLDTDYSFHANRAVTKKEFYTVMKGVFRFEPTGQGVTSNDAITRGEFIKSFDAAMSKAMQKIS
ncbi:MAG: S-layer homology domain-containing protein [Acidobacteriota bacterium]